MNANWLRRAMWVPVLAALVGRAAAGQSETKDASGLPPGMEAMGAVEYAQKADAALKGASSATESAIRKRAVALLAGFDVARMPTAEYGLVYNLHRLAGGEIDPSDNAALRQAVEKRVDAWTGKPYEDIRGKIALMLRLKLHFQAYSEAQRWIAAGGTLEQIQQTALGQEDMKNPNAPLVMKLLFSNPQTVVGNFSIRWEGRVVAPQTGTYTFAISPINVSASYRDYRVHQTMTVEVGGKKIIEATPEAWVSDSNPVELTANQPVALRVETTIESSSFPRGALHALLFWKGPDGKREIVPRAALRLPDRDEPGLLATYRFRRQDQETSVTQTDRTIDFVWPMGGLLVAGDAVKNQAADAVADALWNSYSSDTLLDALEQLGEAHPLLRAAEGGAANLSSAQRQSFLKTMILRKVLLDPIEPMPFLWVYRSFRMGATDEALELFGAWGERHSNRPCQMPDSLIRVAVDYEMRKACRRLAVCFTHELPAHRDRLRDEFLTLKDGSCNLPVAYTLGYCFQSQGRMNEWKAFLDKSLGDDRLVGDRRVNWLLARALAAEIEDGQVDLFAGIAEQVMDGEPWLKEASLHAQSPETKARVASERAARLAALGEFEAARSLLQAAAAGAPPEVAQQVAAWRASVDSYETATLTQGERHAAQRKADHLATLKRRREMAAARGDTESARRYDELINKAGDQ